MGPGLPELSFFIRSQESRFFCVKSRGLEAEPMLLGLNKACETPTGDSCLAYTAPVKFEPQPGL